MVEVVAFGCDCADSLRSHGTKGRGIEAGRLKESRRAHKLFASRASPARDAKKKEAWICVVSSCGWRCRRGGRVLLERLWICSASTGILAA